MASHALLQPMMIRAALPRVVPRAGRRLKWNPVPRAAAPD
ncbi:hypothetical protein HMPREF9603_02117 [Cutibacterium acnes HL001PA1]|nr:hypothetical protein HMPREF9603_02117 [Cutibacterium acnes HL001PA1]